MKKKQLFVNVYRAENVSAHDGSGTSDPFIRVSLGGIMIKTKIVEKSLNPVFNQ